MPRVKKAVESLPPRRSTRNRDGIASLPDPTPADVNATTANQNSAPTANGNNSKRKRGTVKAQTSRSIASTKRQRRVEEELGHGDDDDPVPARLMGAINNAMALHDTPNRLAAQPDGVANIDEIVRDDQDHIREESPVSDMKGDSEEQSDVEYVDAEEGYDEDDDIDEAESEDGYNDGGSVDLGEKEPNSSRPAALAPSYTKGQLDNDAGEDSNDPRNRHPNSDFALFDILEPAVSGLEYFKISSLERSPTINVSGETAQFAFKLMAGNKFTNSHSSWPAGFDIDLDEDDMGCDPARAMLDPLKALLQFHRDVLSNSEPAQRDQYIYERGEEFKEAVGTIQQAVKDTARLVRRPNPLTGRNMHHSCRMDLMETVIPWLVLILRDAFAAGTASSFIEGESTAAFTMTTLRPVLVLVKWIMELELCLGEIEKRGKRYPLRAKIGLYFQTLRKAEIELQRTESNLLSGFGAREMAPTGVDTPEKEMEDQIQNQDKQWQLFCASTRRLAQRVQQRYTSAYATKSATGVTRQYLSTQAHATKTFEQNMQRRKIEVKHRRTTQSSAAMQQSRRKPADEVPQKEWDAFELKALMLVLASASSQDLLLFARQFSRPMNEVCSKAAQLKTAALLAAARANKRPPKWAQASELVNTNHH
jgi:hypothetical protein